MPWRRHEAMDGDGCMELGEIRLEGIEVRCEAERNLAGGRVALDGWALAAEEGPSINPAQGIPTGWATFIGGPPSSELRKRWLDARE